MIESFSISRTLSYRGEKGFGDKANIRDVESANAKALSTEEVIKPLCLEEECGINVSAEVVSTSGLFRRCTVEETLTCERAGSPGCAVASPNEHSMIQVAPRHEDGQEVGVNIVFRG